MVKVTSNPSKGTSNTHILIATSNTRKWHYTPAPMSYLILPTTWGKIHLHTRPLHPFPISCLLLHPSLQRKRTLDWTLPAHNQELSLTRMVNMISQGKKRWTWNSPVTSPSCSSSALLQYVVRLRMKKVKLSWQGRGWQNAMYSAKGTYKCTVDFLKGAIVEHGNFRTVHEFNNCIM